MLHYSHNLIVKGSKVCHLEAAVANSAKMVITWRCIALVPVLLFSNVWSAKSIFEDKKTTIYIRAVQCNASEMFVVNNFSCFAKSYSRTISTVNVAITLKRPLSNIHVSLSNCEIISLFILKVHFKVVCTGLLQIRNNLSRSREELIAWSLPISEKLQE